MPFVMAVTGPKRSGKTTLVRNMITDYFLDKFNTIVVLAPTLRRSKDYEFLRNQKKANFYLQDKRECFGTDIQKVFKKCDDLADQGKECHILLILDDCGTDRIMDQRGFLDEYSIQHRHSNLSILIVAHSLRGAGGQPKTLRLQNDYNIIFSPASMVELNQILKDCLLPVDVAHATRNIIKVFSEKYNYVVYQSAETYPRKMLVNFKIPLLEYAPDDGNNDTLVTTTTNRQSSTKRKRKEMKNSSNKRVRKEVPTIEDKK